MTNERNTEILTREMLRDLGYYAEPAILVKEQDSDNPRIEKLLKNASKKGNGCGKPEFIIRSTRHPDLLIVIECKGSTTKHISKNRDKYAAFACDGALLYASFLSKEYDVIAVGISGEKVGEHKISCFVHLKGADAAYDLNTNILLTWEDFRSRYLESPQKFQADYTSLLSYSQTLNLKLHKLKVKESQRSLLISAILIALKNHAFSASFTIHRNAKTLASVLVQTVISELVFANVSKDKIENLAHAYSFVKTQSILTTQEGELVDLIQEIDAEINGFMKSHKYLDTLGQFYIEFLRYANNDKGLGIVLTPPHITELFAELAELSRETVVIDTCCGTGGFLISAMRKMIAQCQGDSEQIRLVEEERLIGIETQDDIYALAISNMILQDDGKSGIILGSAFNKHKGVREKRPTVAMLNPPYKAETSDVEELEFVLNAADYLEREGKCLALIPLSCVLAQEGAKLDLKRRIMSAHTIEAIMSLPEDLFHNSKVMVTTCILVLTVHKPHPKGKKTWLGYWRNDGFVKVKGRGRIDRDGQWERRQGGWLRDFRNREADGQSAVMRELKLEDEWCAEAFLTTDYGSVTEKDFAKEVRKYLAFKIIVEDGLTGEEDEVSDA